jgi:hypothetical protein
MRTSRKDAALLPAGRACENFGLSAESGSQIGAGGYRMALAHEGAKDAAGSEAHRRSPNQAAWFARKCDDAKAEAALIAAAGLLREVGR